MKLWQVIQWGNYKDGPDGWDTQCVVSAPTLEEAVKFAETIFPLIWKSGKAEVVYLLGQDNKDDSKGPQLIIPVWVMSAFNLGNNPDWFFDSKTQTWVDGKTMFPTSSNNDI